MANGRRARSGFAKKIDTVHWTYGSFDSLSSAAGIVAVNVMSAQHLPETLLRIRGEWMAQFTGPLAPNAGIAVTVGLILVPEGTGTTALWSPVTDGDAPWIWWDVFHLIYREFVVDVVQAVQASSARRVLDSKAMRKIRNTELQFVVERAVIGGLSDVNTDVAGSLRVLAGS